MPDSSSSPVRVVFATPEHVGHASALAALIDAAAQDPNTGLARRTATYIAEKMRAGNAVIAIGPGDEAAGFCYVETWEHGRYIANSGLIVSPDFRGHGLAKRIKACAFELSRTKYPDAKVFGLTTSPAVMSINSDLGYRPVAFAELTSDDAFWAGCQTCAFFDVLTRTHRVNCLCTGMLYDPTRHEP